MSDGMSDSRPYDTQKESWDMIDGIQLKVPVEAWFYQYRDGVAAVCPLFCIEFTVSRWGGVLIREGLPDGKDAIGFVGQDAMELARKAMHKQILKKLQTEKYSKYVKEGGTL
jgi:hypothetical protein